MHHETCTPPDTAADGPEVGRVRVCSAAAREVCVVVEGELDLATVPHLLDLSRAALALGTAVVVLDLSAVEFVDCSGLRGLVAARAMLLAAGCSVTVPAPSAAVVRLLSWTSMTEHFAVDASPHP